MGQKNTFFGSPLLSKEGLSEKWVRKFGKNGETSYQKKSVRKIVSSDTKASPGRTDANVQICLQTQTSCRLETGMGDYVAAVMATVAAYRRCKQRIKHINQLALVLGVATRRRCNRVPSTLAFAT